MISVTLEDQLVMIGSPLTVALWPPPDIMTPLYLLDLRL